ncbi:MAG: 3-oxoacyl-ACP synthase [Desulfobacterales bacterium]|nr:MAG: 3-oxoacyl-ACP synthase [Desulfobacterales bacterium]
MSRRVVITAGAAITPVGHGRTEILHSLKNRISGIRPIKPNDLLARHIHSGVFGTVDAKIDYGFARRYRKTMGPVAYYACQVVKEALAESGLPEEMITSGRTGVAFGSTHGSPTVQRDIYRTFFSPSDEEYASIGSVDYLKSMVHTTAVNITKMFGITGRVISSSTACTTSSQSIGYGYEAVKFGMQDIMICGGADEYDTTTVAVFDNLLACSTSFNDTPRLTPRPFDEARDGLVVGEGAGAVVLEEYESARRRGAPILAEIIGFDCNNNGGDLILPSADGIQAVLRSALGQADIDPRTVDLVSAHATATRMGDVVEAMAMRKIYGETRDDAVQGPEVVALKSYMGHTMAACGVLETLMAIWMAEEGYIAPTLNLTDIDPRCAGLRHVTEGHEAEIRTAVVQNFAFGGVNTCLVLRRPDA